MKYVGSCIVWLCMAVFLLLPVSTSVAVSDQTGIAIFLAHRRPKVLNVRTEQIMTARGK